MKIHIYIFPERTSEEVLSRYGCKTEKKLSGIPLSNVNQMIKTYGGSGLTLEFTQEGRLLQKSKIVPKDRKEQRWN